MSRDGSQSKIDNIRNSAINTNRQTRTALNNAVRYNAMLQLYNDVEPDQSNPEDVRRSSIRNALSNRDPRTITDSVLASALDESIQDITKEFNTAVGSEEEIGLTAQAKMTNKAFRTDLGRIVAGETSFNRGRFFEANNQSNLISHGAGGYAFGSYLSSFQEGSDDAFGSRVVYDNVFGAYESGEVSLRERNASIDPEDYGAVASQKVLQTLVNKNILDSRHTLNKVDREFERFFGESAVAAASESGTGLVRARSILNNSIERSIQLQQDKAVTEFMNNDPNNAAFKERVDEINKEIAEEQLDQKAYLDSIKQSYSSRRTGESGTKIINKGGVREFVDLFNSADSEITIQTYQLQNQTIGTSIRDVIRRRVLEKAVGGDTKGFNLNLVLAYPKQRTTGNGSTEDDRYNIGSTGYGINGPNLIEALTMKEFELDLIEELVELGYAREDASKLINVNLEFRDRKFHPKVYLTDTMAAIGTQNLTAPVGNSINQAGSNFEQMYIARNYIIDDDELRATRQQAAITSEKSLSSNITSSLLYRQIKQASQYEREFIKAQNGMGTSPALNMGGRSFSANYNVGFAGDIYNHLTNTIDFAHQQSKGINNVSTNVTGGKNVVANRNVNMFMILDGAFMLQLGDIAFNEKALVGEMGDEVTKTFNAKDAKVSRYRSYQNKLFDLLITNQANVVVDKKNYKEAVYDPIAEKIEKQGSERLKRKFVAAGKNLGLMAGNNIFGADVATMNAYLKAQGFTDDAGFSDSDRKQLMGMGSGNIRMAKVPRQHAKSFGLVDYTEGGPNLISYYQGSSNMGFYSLDAADKTNTEMGIMFGKGTGLSRVTNQAYVSSYANNREMEAVQATAEQVVMSSNQMHDFSLTEEEEINELRNIQDRFFQTYNQLSSNTIENRYIQNISNAPMWQSNVNSGALQIQKARLEDLRDSLGLKDTAFKIVERQGEDGGIKSLNITINMATVLGSDDFTDSTTGGKKLTFEISVLNSPKDKRIINRNSPTDPRNGSSEAPGMVYFVDKNKLIGNGIFVNDSGQAIDVLGRRKFEDNFQYGMDEGTVSLKSGESAHMSSIDITTNIFGQLIGEAVAQKALQDPAARYNRIVKRGLEDEVLTDYLSVLLKGKKSHISKDGTETSALDLIKNINFTELDEVIGMLMVKTGSKYGSASEVKNLIPSVQKQMNAGFKEQAILDLVNVTRNALKDTNTNLFGNNNDISLTQRNNIFEEDSTMPFLSGEGVAEEFLEKYLLPSLKQLVKSSPELIGEVLKYTDTNLYDSIETANIAAKQSMIFEPFLQSVEDTTYGGQQGYYRTLMYGLSGGANDTNTGEIMDDYDDTPGIHQARRYARLTALSYTPTTDIHEFLYRSIASGASSTGKTDPSLGNTLLQQKGRQVGSAHNFDVLQSVGIGTKINRSDYVTGYGDELQVSGAVLESLKSQNLSDAEIEEITEKIREDYKRTGRQFMSQDGIDTQNMLFFTGNAGKISQLPQRIKNALGARPLYQYGMEAQQALTSGNSLQQITNDYISKFGKNTDDFINKQVSKQQAILMDNTNNYSVSEVEDAADRIALLSSFKQDLSVKTIKTSSGKTQYQAGQLLQLGAVYTGRLKTILSADQAKFVERIKEDLDAIFDHKEEEDTKEERELRQELIRTYVLKASINNSGLGKMIAGNDRTKYNIALLQMSGTYTDTFLANPLLGNVYKSKTAYDTLKNNGVKVDTLTVDREIIVDGERVRLDDYMVVAGQREGYMVTQQLSTKGSMIAEESDLKATTTLKGGSDLEAGERMLFREGDVIVEDDQGRFVHKRDGEVIRTAGNKRTFSTQRGEVDNTTFGISSSVATKSTAAYGRRGEASMDYIFASMERDGNFANNEYLQELVRLRSIVAGGARRIEGTDSGTLAKGVANFAGMGEFNIKGKMLAMNTFQFIETQIEDKFEKGQVGGSLGAMLRAENRAYVFNQTINKKQVYTPLSSMISGVYNANNFKSFVWSHGATILKETKGTGDVANNFMLNELLGIGKNSADRVELAKKAASGLLLSFGSSYLEGGDDAAFKKSIIQGLLQGAAGKNYQKLIGVMHITEANKLAGKSDDARASFLFDELIKKEKEKKGIYFSDGNLAGMRGLKASDISLIMSGNPKDPAVIKATERFMGQLEGLISTQAKDIAGKGFMEMSSFTNRQAALMVTAIDIMNQIAANETSYRLPGDINTESKRMKQVMTSILGGNAFTTANDEKVFGTEDSGLMDEAFEMIQGLNQNVNMVALYADIVYSQSKDPVGTETVGRHEAQHLMTPFLGDLKAFRKGGQLHNMQHTFASLLSLSQGVDSITAYNAMSKSGFGSAKAWDMSTVNDEQRLLMSSFTQEKFLGFYRSLHEDEDRSVKLRREFKKINKIMTSGKYHDLQVNPSFDETTEAGQKAKADYDARVKAINKDIENYAEKFYSINGGVIDARIKQRKIEEIRSKVFGTDGAVISQGMTEFLMDRQDLVIRELSSLNDKFNANIDKALGSDATSKFIEGMQNKDMFFSLPELQFSNQDGMITATSRGSISTFLPSADMMKKLGVQHSDFIDPLIGVYKDLAEIFVPGSVPYNALNKVMAAQNESKSAILTAAEGQALLKVMQAATRMPLEARKAIQGARPQEAFGSKTKYKGFTSTGVGSFLINFDAIALSSAKLAEAGLDLNDRKTEALQGILQARNALNIVKKTNPDLDSNQTLGVLSEEGTKKHNARALRNEVNQNNLDDPWLSQDSRSINQGSSKGEVVLDNLKPSTGLSATPTKNAIVAVRKHHKQTKYNKSYTTRSAINAPIDIGPGGFIVEDSLQGDETGRVTRVVGETIKLSDETTGNLAKIRNKKSIHSTPKTNRLDPELDIARPIESTAEKGPLFIDVSKWLDRVERVEEENNRWDAAYLTAETEYELNKLGDLSAMTQEDLTNKLKSSIDDFITKNENSRLDGMSAAAKARKLERAQDKAAKAAYIKQRRKELVPPRTQEDIEEYNKSIRGTYGTTARKTSIVADGYLQKDILATKSVRSMHNRIDAYYNLQMHALVQGMSKELKDTYTTFVEAAKIQQETLINIYDKVSSGAAGYKDYEEAIFGLYSARDGLNAKMKESMTSSDKYLFETAALNLEKNLLDFEIQTGLTRRGDKLRVITQEQMEAKQAQRGMLNSLTNFLNSTDMDPYELFDERYSPSGGLTLGEISGTSSIVQTLEGLNTDITDDAVRKNAQKELALKHLDDLKTQRVKEFEAFREFSSVRNGKDMSEAEEEAAYSEMRKAHQTILESIEVAKQEVKSGKLNEEQGIDRVFTSLNVSMIVNDKINLQFAEVFRSPPPGSTDPRLHSYRIMNGVTALNRIATMVGAGGMSEVRNQTTTYIGAVGMVTYGGGDFDGDPYTTILHEREETARNIMNTRLEIQRDEVLLSSYSKNPIKGDPNDPEVQKQLNLRAAKQNELEAGIRTKKETLLAQEASFDKQLKVGYEKFDSRARKQAAEFFGIDQRTLVKAGEQFEDSDSGEMITGVGTRTFNADSVFTLMNTGHGLVEGLDQKGETLFNIYDTFDKAFGIRKDAFGALKQMRVAAAKYGELKAAGGGIIAESSQGDVLQIFREATAKTRALVNDNSDFIGTILSNNDAKTAQYLLETLSDIEAQELSYRGLRGHSQDLLNESDENTAISRQFMHHFIGGTLFNKIQENETYQGFMKKGAGMQINEGGMDVLLKTLGKAGGEVLGKTYNTIIGTTFKDSPLITFAQAVLNPELKKEDGSLYNLIEKDFIARAEGNERIGRDSATVYFTNLQSALDQARGTQGFMKNIHQLLRDSIKLKSDNDLITELEKASVNYGNISEKLREHDRSMKGTPGYQKERDRLLMDRDGTINNLSSGLGDGPGLKALIDLDFLINQSKKGDNKGQKGITAGQFSFMFLESGDIKSPEFNSLVDRYNQEIVEQLNMIEGNSTVDERKKSRINNARLSENGVSNLKNLDPTDAGASEDLLKVAQYHVANQLTNLVTGYRMSTSTLLESEHLKNQSDSYLRQIATDTGKSLQDAEKSVIDDYRIPSNPLDVMSEQGKAKKLRKIEALSSYLKVDNSSLYQGNEAQANAELQTAVQSAADNLGISKNAYLLTFDEKYENSRRQAQGMMGGAGEGLSTFTSLEGMRSDMANLFRSGNADKDDRMEKLLGVMDSEAMQMASQLIGSDKLSTEGFDAFTRLFEGILSNVMVDSLDKIESELLETAKQERKNNNLGPLSDEELMADPDFKKKVAQVKAKEVRKRSIQLTFGGGEGEGVDRSTSMEGVDVRSVTAQMMEKEEFLNAYEKTVEGSLASQQAKAVEQLATHILTKSGESDESFNQLLNAVGSKVGLTAEEKAGLSEKQQNALLQTKQHEQRSRITRRLKEQQRAQFRSAIKQQLADRQKLANDNPYLKRGSMLNKLSNTMINSLATNKGSTTLDLLAPIAITAVGAAISEGDVDATTLQDLGGATFQAAMYARTGFVDGSKKVYAKRMAQTQAVASVFKFRSALQRYEGQGYAEGEKVAMAVKDTIIRESISMAVNKAYAPAVAQSIASKLGNNTSIASDMMTGKKHQAVQQLSGNIGASLISAATSTLISGLILKTAIPNPEKNMNAELQQFEVNVATMNAVNEQIAASRAQQAAKEDLEVADSGGEPEISAYSVVTSSTYGADSQADSIALYEPQELDLASDGSIDFNFG